VRRQALHSISIEVGTPMNLISLIKICLNETYSKVHIGKKFSNAFSIQNG